MRRTLPLSVLTVAVLSGCSSVDLKPVTKPTNPRVIERELVMSQPSAQRPVDRVLGGGPAKAQPDETADLPVMPSRSSSSVGHVASTAVVPAKDKTVAATVAPKLSTPNTASTVAGKDAVAAMLGKGGPKTLEEALKGQAWNVKAADVRLATTFERWAKESTEQGRPYSVLWDAGNHVLIEAPTQYRGTFLDAVEQALKSPSILESDYPLEACEYPNSPPVIRITRQGEQAKECPDYR